MSTPKFKIKETQNDQFMFNLHATNGQIILSSEQYTTKQGCKNGIASVQKNAPNDARFERKQATNGQFFFILKASNGEPIGKSELYTSKAARENGIASVQKNAPIAIIEDTSVTV